MNRQTAIIITVITALCCGLPGCFSLCFGGIFALTGSIPGADIDVMGSSDPTSAILFGLAMLCGGIIFLAIPIVFGVVTLRRPKVEALVSNEPLPPAS